jgi:hypothetical protein
VVLHADEHAKFFPVLRTAADILCDPLLDFVAACAVRDRFPRLRAHLRVGEDAHDRRAQFRGHLHGLLHPRDVFRPRSLVGDGEVVSRARAADAQPQLEATLLQRKEKRVRRRRPLAITGKIIRRRVDAIEVVLRRELGELDQADTFAAVQQLVVEQSRERVGVERNAEVGTADPLGRLDRRERRRSAEPDAEGAWPF